MKQIAILAAILAMTGCASAFNPDKGLLYTHDEHHSFDGEVSAVSDPSRIQASIDYFREKCHAEPPQIDQVIRVTDGHFLGFTGPYSANPYVNGLNLHLGDIVHVEDNGNMCDGYPRVTKVIKRGNGEFRVLGIKISGSHQ